MATRESFSHDFSSSNDENESPQFRTGALPKLSIPSPFQSGESSEGFETGNGADTPSTHGSPGTPISPLGTEFSFLGVSSQPSDPEGFSNPRPRKKQWTKKRADNFKCRPLFGRPEDVSTSKSSKRTKLARPTSELFVNIPFPSAEESLTVKVSDGTKMGDKQLNVPRGNQIFNLEILANVFTLLICPDKSCGGRPRLHQHITRDGLQRFFLLKCYSATSLSRTSQLPFLLVHHLTRASIKRHIALGRAR